MTIFVATLEPSLHAKLKSDLEGQGFEFTKPPYTHFQARKPGLTVTLYQSKKLTVAGKNKDEFITFYLEPEILQTFTYGQPKKHERHPRIGVDESGKGDFFGPLCIAAVYADESTVDTLVKLGVKDSKAMRDPQIVALAKKIRATCPYEVIQIGPAKYNELYAKFNNLNSLLAWGHATSIESVASKTGCKTVIIDQFASEHVVETALKRKSLDVHLTQRHRGEEDVVVAAASILARASFVSGMERLSEQFGIKLPFGANSRVITAGKELVIKHGKEALTACAKLHFKTTNQII